MKLDSEHFKTVNCVLLDCSQTSPKGASELNSLKLCCLLKTKGLRLKSF